MVGAVVLAYATAFRGGFQFDDFRVVVGDPGVQSLAAWWRAMPGLRPLLKLSYALNHQSGLGLAGFHAVNLAAHAAAALLALELLRRLGRCLRPSPPPGAPLLGALLFALHPVQTEAVTYVSGRSSSLAGALALASVLVFARRIETGKRGLNRFSWAGYAASPLLLALSLLVKEGAVVLPLALLAVLALDARAPFRWRAALRATSSHWAVVAIAVAGGLLSPRYREMVIASLRLRSFADNLATQHRATGWLSAQLVRPWRSNADPALETARGVGGFEVAGIALLLLLLVAAGIALLRWPVRQRLAAFRPGASLRPVAGFALLWFLLWLAPQGWWLPRPEPASERQLYLALLGPAWFLGCALTSWKRALRSSAAWRRLPAATTLALLALLLGFTARRSLDYASEVAFWSDVLERSPHNARAWNNLGYALATRCDAAGAEQAFLQALALAPGDFRAGANLRLLREGSLAVCP